MGAAGRDFHNFNTIFRNNSAYCVKAFTATQIPFIENRTYPPELSGPFYPNGIPIYPESELAECLKKEKIDEVVFSYSDVSNEEVMQKAAFCNARGADFTLLSAQSTMLRANKPVISVCAVRTGCGKSQTSHAVARMLSKLHKKTAVIRHPMPYGDLRAQVCQRYESLADLDRHHCTIEEREEYEAHITTGHLLFAGVDYQQILNEAEKEVDVILWDGGNNDLPFYKPDLHIVLVDPHRPGHELSYYPSLANLQLADVVMVAKVGTASKEGIAAVERNIARFNSKATVVMGDSVIAVEQPEQIRGKKVLVIEDGPTLTHGGMRYGAATIAAQKYGAAEIVDPRPYAVGSIKGVLEKYSHLERVLPAMGYTKQQIRELEKTVESVPCDLVLVGTPLDLGNLLKVSHPVARVTYELDQAAAASLGEIISKRLLS
ncbi:MAG: GTPase [Deltaproteobacteria bacterium]|nr:GTPase [Deltaproteobacteria bacterium]